jgi:hypothetical protein
MGCRSCLPLMRSASLLTVNACGSTPSQFGTARSSVLPLTKSAAGLSPDVKRFQGGVCGKTRVRAIPICTQNCYLQRLKFGFVIAPITNIDGRPRSLAVASSGGVRHEGKAP